MIAIDNTTSRLSPKTQTRKTRPKLMSGDEAVAWAAVDAGVRFASAYPGTPVTEILESLEYIGKHQMHLVWSVNEKVAYESALAIGIGGQRALVAMKQGGLNVAADAFINSCPAGTNGGLLLVVGDDPHIHSSMHKQDSRMYRPIAGTLLLEPADSQEAYSMSREAFRLSEQFRLPIMLRLTTRTAHGCTPVVRKPKENPAQSFSWSKDPRFFAIPTLSRQLFLRLAELEPAFGKWIVESKFTCRQDSTSERGERVGILCTGLGYSLARELKPPKAGILKVAGEPFPDAEIRRFVQYHSKVIVLEEGDPILETRARAFASEDTQVYGRQTKELRTVGELQAAEIAALLNGNHGQREEREGPAALPARLPEICKPCGYHKVFGALKLIPDIATPSDIGCNTLGGLPPYSVMDGLWAMGSSIGVACGLAAARHPRIVAIIGDSTFFHAGIPPLIEAVHQRYKMTVLLLDNGTTAMTGGQNVAHRTTNESIQQSVDLIKVIEAIGVARCSPFDPHKLGQAGIREMIEHSFSEAGVKVLLYRSQCGLYSPGYQTEPPFAIKRKETHHEI